jgi:hypothetical protein
MEKREDTETGEGNPEKKKKQKNIRNPVLRPEIGI